MNASFILSEAWQGLTQVPSVSDNAFSSANATAPQWMVDFVNFRKQLFLRTVEPIIVALLGPVEEDYDALLSTPGDAFGWNDLAEEGMSNHHHRRLSILPKYLYDDENSEKAFRATSMTFAALMMLFLTLSCVFLIFLSCFYHDQKTSPLFISPRRHRLPKLVPPPLPVDGYFSWIKVCLFMSDEEIINRIGYDSLIFLRFHRLALRCIVKMSLFSFVVLLPLNYTGSGNAAAQDLKGYVGSIFFTDFMRFTMANVMAGSPRLWVHCFAAYLLTGIVVRELLVEYETFNSIRHRYLLSREPHLRTVLVKNIPRHLRSAKKITNYFKHVYPNAVRSVFMCQNLTHLEQLVQKRTGVLSQIEKELLILCRNEKKKLYEPALWRRILAQPLRLDECAGATTQNSQERLDRLYSQLEQLNNQVEQEQSRRKRVMKMLDRMDAGEGAHDIDYVLASPFVTDDPSQRRVLGLGPKQQQQQQAPPEQQPQQQQQQQQRQPSFTAPGMDGGHPASIPEGDETRGDDSGAGFEPVTSYTNIPDNETNNNNKTTSRLRSRSPAGGVVTEPADTTRTVDEDTYRKTKRPEKANAKRAIKRYGRFSKDVSFLGRPIRSSGEVPSDSRIEDHINEVTDKAFVVMRTFTAATIAIQSMHSSKPGSMQVVTAPEPRDVLWDNVYVSKGARRTRSILGEVLVDIIICFYVVPIAMISLLVSEKALISSSPRLAQLHQASAFFSAGIQMIQPLCIVALQQLQPPLFMAIGRMEGMACFSEVQMRAFSRYFFFQVLNVFLATTIAGTVFDTIALIVENPELAFVRLGNSLPRMSSFFITFVTIKTFLGLGVEMVRLMALVQASVRYVIFPNATFRRRRTPFIGMRSIDDPGWFPFHKILAQDMLVVVISVVFAVVAPLVLLPCAIFCVVSRIMWTHHHMYVYESVFESGGEFWPKIFRRFVFGLVIAQMTITGQFLLKGARHEAYATIFLIFLTYMFLRWTRRRYDPTSSTLPLEVATVMDISLRQEEEGQIDDSVQRQASSTSGVGPPGGSNTNSPRKPSDPGALIGRHDPFRKAYLQPALRASPRARPEQPFPAAQLGREEALRGTEGLEEAWQDSGATVRLKTLDQQHRRLINRWWEDQLQRAGDQNLLWILAGEECGTLTLSGPSTFDNDFGSRASMAESHSFV